MTSPTLRDYLQSIAIENLVGNSTHNTVPEICRALGLPDAPPTGSKRERYEASFGRVSDVDLGRVGENYLRMFSGGGAGGRNKLQDLIWASGSFPEIPKRVRRELSRMLTDPLLCRTSLLPGDIILIKPGWAVCRE